MRAPSSSFFGLASSGRAEGEIVARSSPTQRDGQRLAEAAAAYEAGRYADAERELRGVLARRPDWVEAHELMGLVLYRLGRWEAAIAELEAFEAATGSVDQHHVLADCWRALGRHGRVDELWSELSAASPDGEIVTEGRIVAAGSLVDRGEARSALRLLRKGPVRPRRVRPSTVRLWYAIADLEERLGDVASARSGFERVVAHAPDLADAKDRLRQLS